MKIGNKVGLFSIIDMESLKKKKLSIFKNLFWI